MPFDEDELLPISALQHLVFCERQAALIHVERVWVDNALTTEGHGMHQRVHETGDRREHRGTLVITRGLKVRSLTIGIAGVCDVVEFHECRGGNEEGCVSVPDLEGYWRVHPVEHKRGRPKLDGSDEVQLCAQSLCLEEMLNCRIASGAIYYGRTRRRKEVLFTAQLREKTISTASRMHEIITTGVTPVTRRQPKCRRCSLQPVCRPDVTGRGPQVAAYLDRIARCQDEPS